MTEAQLTTGVIDTARRLGYIAAHFRTSRTTSGGYSTAVQGDGKGYPDLTLVGRGRVLFAELKVGKGKLRPEQEMWGDLIKINGGEWHLWTDADWNSGAIEQALR